MTEPTMEQYSCRYFSIANPESDSEDDLPMLLRRFADELEVREIGAQEVIDVTFSYEITAAGLHWLGTVYWKPK